MSSVCPEADHRREWSYSSLLRHSLQRPCSVRSAWQMVPTSWFAVSLSCASFGVRSGTSITRPQQVQMKCACSAELVASNLSAPFTVAMLRTLPSYSRRRRLRYTVAMLSLSDFVRKSL